MMDMRLKRTAVRLIAGLAGLPIVLGGVCCAQAAAAQAAPHWTIISQPAPAYFHAGDTSDFYWIEALNDGGASSSGKIVLRDTLPEGLEVKEVEENEEMKPAVRASAGNNEQAQYGAAVEMSCTTAGGSPQTVECATESSVPTGDRVIAKVMVEVPAGAEGPLHNVASISSGGAAEASTSNATPVVAPTQPVPYGVHLEAEATQEDGELATQAGSHPFAFSTQFATNVGSVNPEENGGDGKCSPPSAISLSGCPEIGATPKDVEVHLPPGFVGDPLAVPRCSQQQFQLGGNAGCPADTQVGDVYLAFFGPGTHEQYAPVYNIEPTPGQPAELGFTVGGSAHVPMLFHVRSDGDYGLSIRFANITTFDTVRLASVMIWGVPAAEAHDPMRESAINGCEPRANREIGCASDAVPAKPFLTMPSSCSGEALAVPLLSDAWQAPGTIVSGTPEAMLAPLTGCGALSFSPEAGLSLSTTHAGAPAGYTVHLKVPQAGGAEEFATPNVRNVELTLPAGTEISPAAANGLVGCSEERFGRSSGRVGRCPAESKIGTVRIHTPLLLEPIEGNVYVGRPECSPCTQAQADDGRMVRLLIEAKMPEPPPGSESPAVLVKLVGRTKIDATTGQLTAVFPEDPQLPFDELEVALEEGPRSPLTNPTTCGPAVAVAKLTPWSIDEASTVTATNPPNIEGCSSPGFTPSLVAGMTSSARGGSFSSFEVSLSRPDGQQDIGPVTLHMPPGLAAILAKVPLCGEAQANAGTCAAASQIGEVTAAVGSGSQPYVIRGGRVFLTERYGGGPFGLSLVVPAEAGPFHLTGLNGIGGEGNGSIVIRGSIKVDPKTAAITIATNAPPTRLDGIPLHLQKVLVNIDRSGFMFNPTNCNAMSVEGVLTSSAGASVSSKYPFQSTDCAALPFRPGFRVSTKARHTRRFGAYLHVKVTSGSGQANIKSVFVKLPRILPSRDETLTQACTEKQFAEDPAGCPAGSHVGTAIARTPVLPVPLTGPAIFVSHGGVKFPDLDVVLQGDGVTVDLTGITNIQKNVTTSDFKSVPDVPISSFELTLPTGSHSALAATGNLCFRTVAKRVRTKKHGKTVFRKRHVRQRRTLIMPTTITGQNGAVVEQSTKVAVRGCGGGKVGGHRKRHGKKG